MEADTSEVEPKEVLWWQTQLGVAVIVGLLTGLLAFSASWFSVHQANKNSLEVVNQSAMHEVAFQQKLLEQSRKEEAFLAFMDATQELSRIVFEDIKAGDRFNFNKWSERQGPGELGGILVDAGITIGYLDAAPLPTKSKRELWETVNANKNKLQIVCNPNELNLINNVIDSLHVEKIVYPDVAHVGGEESNDPMPVRHFPILLSDYENARLALINAYRHDVLNLEPLPLINTSSSPSPPVSDSAE